MKHVLRLVVCCVVFACILPAVGEEDDVVAKTPSSLLALLPDDENQLPGPFYLVRESPAGVTLSYWSISASDQHIRIDVNGVLPRHERVGQVRHLKYSSEGHVQSTYARNEVSLLGPAYYVEHFREVRDGQSFIKSVTHDDGESVESTRIGQPVSLQKHNAIIEDWLPLALGYHLRAGHSRFVIRLYQPGASNRLRIMEVEKLDAEIEEEGQPEEVHILSASIHYETLDPEGEPVDQDLDHVMRIHCSASGTILRQSYMIDEVIPPYEVLSERISEDLIRERFGDDVLTRLQGKANPPGVEQQETE